MHQLAHALIAGSPQAEGFGVLAEPAVDLGYREVAIVQVDEGFHEDGRDAWRENGHDNTVAGGATQGVTRCK